MTKKKFLLVNYEYPPLGGGGGNATYSIAKELAKEGVNVTVLTCSFRDIPRYQKRENIQVIRIWGGRRKLEKCSIFEMILFLFNGLLKSKSISRKIKPDACLIFFSLPTGPIGWWIKRSLGIPYVISLQGGDVPGFMKKELHIYHLLTNFITQNVWKNAEFVVSNSEGLSRLAKKFMDNAGHKTIPAGVDLQTFNPIGKSRMGSKTRLLFVGRLVYQKGLDILLEALKEIKDSDLWSLDIIGDGPLRKEILEKAKSLQIDKNINFYGWQSREQLIKIYKDNDIFLIPSRDEGMPNVMLEAMASGLAVIGTKVSGLEEVIINNQNGFLVEKENPHELYEAIKNLIYNKSLIKEIGKNASLFVQKNYSWANAARSYKYLLEKEIGQVNE
ncbi:MAG: hypothetical protein CBC47_03490 [Alphaproteobacteria bacterium TMED87]|nr:glycosyl transferase [Rhodospirillaceae bacterium]OUV10451.1 MAG: hypothetical protein CBC47_03490 [Alphaproteobacteria bacterium TMED87]